jgi:hypothetical protein
LHASRGYDAGMSLSKRVITAAASLAGACAIALCAAAAGAQQYPGHRGVPPYTSWQSGWNTYHYDRAHVILGVVAGFSPYRLTVAARDGSTATIDLKPGTAIFPTGQTPTEGEHVAVLGYWSRGTFIANRVILRP